MDCFAAIGCHAVADDALVGCGSDRQRTSLLYRRHFTKTSHLVRICYLLEHYIKHGDLVVDFSCGSNEWLNMLQEHMLVHASSKIEIVGFDVVTAKYQHGFVLKVCGGVVNSTNGGKERNGTKSAEISTTKNAGSSTWGCTWYAAQRSIA